MVLQDQQLLNELFLQSGHFLMYSDFLIYFCLPRASLCTASSFLLNTLPLIIHNCFVNISGLSSLNKSIHIFVRFSIFPMKWGVFCEIGKCLPLNFWIYTMHAKTHTPIIWFGANYIKRNIFPKALQRALNSCFKAKVKHFNCA